MDDLLMGTTVAPLYKALRESGLGESVISDGLETVLQQVMARLTSLVLSYGKADLFLCFQATYSVGLKGISDSAKCDQIEKLITETLVKV
jgi:hypothetical protein